MYRTLKRIAIGALLLAGFLAGLAWISLTWVFIRPATYAPTKLLKIELRSWPEHNEIYASTSFPYSLSIDCKNGSLEYVGARHTNDAEDSQLVPIESRWQEFKPTVALCEGRKRMYRFATRPQKGTFSESDLVRILAYQNNVPLFSLEPTYEDEVAGLLKHFDAKLIAVYMTLRVFAAESQGVSDSQKNQLAAHLLSKRTAVQGLRNSIATVDELDEFWNSKFPDQPDWRTLKSPDQISQLRKIGDVSREIRGQHMVSTIVELVQKGERVFAVVGASHVIRQELELKRLLID